MKFTVAKELMWMLPYIKESYKFLPQGTQITRLGSWKNNNRYGKDVEASIFTNDDKNFRVYLHIYNSYNPSKEVKKFTKSMLLKTLAHELAHVIEMGEHTPQFRKLEKRLVRRFLQMNPKRYYSRLISKKH